MASKDSKELWRKRLEYIKTRLIRREVAVFSFFLILSFIFWFLNGLSKEISGKISFPVRYINFPEGRVLINNIPSNLTITVKGPGYSILQNKLKGKSDPLIVDLKESAVKIREKNGRSYNFIQSYNFRNELATQLQSEFTVVAVTPDTIFYELDLLARKKVKVETNVEVIPQKQFMIYGEPICVPDSIELSGPKSIIDTILNIKTEQLSFEQLNESITASLKVLPIAGVLFSENNVNLTIRVAQFTEAVIELPIAIINSSDTADIHLFPDKTTVNCVVAFDDYTSFVESPLEAFVDFKDLDINASKKLKVELRNIPKFTSKLKYNPQFVEYLIEKK